MSYEHLLLHRDRQAALQREALDRVLSQAAADRRHAERLSRRAERLLARSAALSGAAAPSGSAALSGARDLVASAGTVSLHPSR